MGAPVPQDDLPSNIVPADDMPASLQRRSTDKTGTDARIAQEAAYKFVAGLADSLLNTPNNLINLVKAGVGTVAGAAGRPDLMPTLTPNPDLARRGLEAVGLIDPNIQPQGTVQKVIDYGVQGAMGGAMTGGASVPRALAGAGLGALSGEAAGATAEMGGGPAAQAVAGMVAPAAVSNIAARVPAAAANYAPRLMQSALKPTLEDQRSGKGARAINTLLEEGINPTNAGVARLNAMMDGLENQITTVLQSRSNQTVDKGQVASRIQDVVNRVERTNPTPQDALRDVHRVYDDFIQNGLVPRNIPLQQANELKRGLYQMLRQKYGVPVADDTINARKALARGFKETMDVEAPEIQPLNARMGDLANARNVAERRAMMEGNKNPAGLALLAHDPMAALGFLADRWGGGKATLARGLYQTGLLPGGILSEVNQQTSPIVTQGILADILRRQQQ